MAKKTSFCCTDCGYETFNWSGQCPSCKAWNTLQEVKISLSKSGKKDNKVRNSAKKLNEIVSNAEIRFETGISELDRVLGGGAVEGSLVLVGGAPGIGKSTLLLQMCRTATNKKILYVSGEESERQLKLRAERVSVSNADLYIMAETSISSILTEIEILEPDIVIIDSIQTISDDEIASSPGSVSQVRDCTVKIMRTTKECGCTTFVVSHITKDGNIAGPKVLEHMVDCVLYFEGENNTCYRILRGIKNRFGSTNEIGVFEMVSNGLACIDNPSEALLSGRPDDCPGTCVTCIIEGSRPILAEVQALVSPSTYNSARRTNGIDYNRAAMLLAVLEKRGGLAVSGCDVYINVVGGITLDEPAADIATVLAAASSFLDRPLGNDLAAIGEVGLSGELRNVNAVNQRLSEIYRLGFRRCVVPSHIVDEIGSFPNLEIIPAKNVYDAVHAVL